MPAQRFEEGTSQIEKALIARDPWGRSQSDPGLGQRRARSTAAASGRPLSEGGRRVADQHPREVLEKDSAVPAAELQEPLVTKEMDRPNHRVRRVLNRMWQRSLGLPVDPVVTR